MRNLCFIAVPALGLLVLLASVRRGAYNYVVQAEGNVTCSSACTAADPAFRCADNDDLRTSAFRPSETYDDGPCSHVVSSYVWQRHAPFMVVGAQGAWCFGGLISCVAVADNAAPECGTTAACYQYCACKRRPWLWVGFTKETDYM